MAALSFTSPIRLSYFTNLPSRVKPKVAAYQFTKSSFLSPGLRSLDSSIAGPVTRYDGRGRMNFTVSAVNKLSDTELLDVPTGTESNPGVLPSSSGVYAVYDGNRDLQFIGISRNIGASILSHIKSLPELCSSVKFGIVDEPERATLTEAWKSWMEEHIAATGKIPPGNKSGDTTWVQKPPQKPAKKKADLRLTPGPHVQLTVPMEELIDRLVKENKVVAFIKGSRYAPLCGFSQRVIGILESEKVDYESIDVLDEEHNRGLREKLKNYNSWPTFPQIYVDGELVGGCDILTSMYEKGELPALFGK